MLLEADLLVRAETMLVEVLGRIRPQDEAVLLPPMFPGAEQPQTLAEAVAQHRRDAAALVEALGGAGSPAGTLAEACQAVCAAAEGVVDGAAPVQLGDERLPARELLLRATVRRSLLAHYVAAHLGSTACPLPEELAGPLHALVAPDAATWREQGWFRAPMPLPEHVSQRDRFLLSAGHEPHPVPH